MMWKTIREVCPVTREDRRLLAAVGVTILLAGGINQALDAREQKRAPMAAGTTIEATAPERTTKTMYIIAPNH